AERLARGVENLRYAFGRRPAQPSIRTDPLALVEGRRIQSGTSRQARRRKPVLGGKPIDRLPDVLMSQHGSIFLVWNGNVSRKFRGNVREHVYAIGRTADWHYGRAARWPDVHLECPTFTDTPPP